MNYYPQCRGITEVRVSKIKKAKACNEFVSMDTKDKEHLFSVNSMFKENIKQLLYLKGLYLTGKENKRRKRQKLFPQTCFLKTD